jgi:hypothetical protein
MSRVLLGETMGALWEAIDDEVKEMAEGNEPGCCCGCIAGPLFLVVLGLAILALTKYIWGWP